MFRHTLKSIVIAAVLAVALASSYAAAWDCPKIDSDAVMKLVTVCVEDPNGLCGDTCIAALTKGATQMQDLKVPCEGGVDGVLENVLKRCTEEVGGTFDPCDGKTRQSLVDNASKVKCIGGGTLADTL